MTRATSRKVAQRLLKYTGNWSTPVLCLGPGLSMAAGAPSWMELARLLMRDVKTIWPEHFDPTQAMEFHAHVAGRPRTIELLRSHYGNLQPTPVHTSLLRLPWRAIVTTNFDTLLEQTLDSLDKPYTVWSSLTKAPTPPGNNLVVKLHGSLDTTREIILTSTDYAKVVRNPVSAVSDYLRFLMSGAPAVFVGYSARSAMDNFFPYKAGASDAAKWVLISQSTKPMERELLKSRGITTIDIPFDSLESVAAELRKVLKRDSGETKQQASGKKRILILGSAQRSVLAMHLRAHLRRKGFETISPDELPGAGLSLMEKLIEVLKSADHAIFIEPWEDPRIAPGARQNMMFELGLAVASMGRQRVMLIANRQFQAPTDLFGLNYILADKNDSTSVILAVDKMIEA
jgi:predicted nucleotide-binding protein